ncbi:MAG: hypothetical protein Q4G30_07460 [Actinomycetaceae bacterium]|nr:hypothetical protein [Actinomycetaceae bacterium]
MSNQDELLALAQDPATPLTTLQHLAQNYPELRPSVAYNPSTYPALLEWLGNLGDPTVDEVLGLREERNSGLLSPNHKTRLLAAGLVYSATALPEGDTPVVVEVEDTEAPEEESSYPSATAQPEEQEAEGVVESEIPSAPPVEEEADPAAFDEFFEDPEQSSKPEEVGLGYSTIVKILLGVIAALLIMLLLLSIFLFKGSKDQESEAAPTGAITPIETPSISESPSKEPSSSPSASETPSETPSPTGDEGTGKPQADALQITQFQSADRNVLCNIMADNVNCTVMRTVGYTTNCEKRPESPATALKLNSDKSLQVTCVPISTVVTTVLEPNKQATSGNFVCQAGPDGKQITCWDYTTKGQFYLGESSWGRAYIE